MAGRRIQVQRSTSGHLNFIRASTNLHHGRHRHHNYSRRHHNDDYHESVHSSRYEIQELHKRVRDLLDSNTSLSQQICGYDALKSSHASIKAEAQRLQDELTRFQNHDQLLRGKVEGLTNRLSCLERENADIRKSVEEAEAEGKEKLQQIRRRHAHIEADRERAWVDREQALADRDAAINERDRALEERNEVAAERNSLSQHVNKLTQEIRENGPETVQQLRADLATATEEVKCWRGRFEDREAQSCRMIKALQECNQHRDELLSSDSQWRFVIRDLRCEVKAQSRIIENQVSWIEKLEKRLRGWKEPRAARPEHCCSKPIILERSITGF